MLVSNHAACRQERESDRFVSRIGEGALNANEIQSSSAESTHYEAEVLSVLALSPQRV